MGLKCSECAKKLDLSFDGDLSWNSWLKLSNYFEIELTQGDITQQTYETMIDALMYIKSYLPQCQD